MAEALRTALSFGDESTGKIVLRGHDLARLAAEESYEAVAGILWHDVVDAQPDALGDWRERIFPAITPLQRMLEGRPAREATRVIMAMAPAPDPIAVVAAVGLAAALAARAESGSAWITPNADRSHADDLLTLATGQAADPRKARALERYMVLMIDHGISASTYAARIAVSTGAEWVACAQAAAAVLERPLHGAGSGTGARSARSDSRCSGRARHDRRDAGGGTARLRLRLSRLCRRGSAPLPHARRVACHRRRRGTASGCDRDRACDRHGAGPDRQAAPGER
ncbi:MAG: hypothetical protein JOY99_13595 [Sphingomonadaceae bacterium]|nr:hypothetical protein [Sphingomonadaceae bacterium]